MTAINTDRDLTPRELEVLQLIAAGLTQRQVAKRLWLSPRTVDCHMVSVRAKLRVHKTNLAVRVALDAGLIPATADWIGQEQFPPVAELEAERHGLGRSTR